MPKFESEAELRAEFHIGPNTTIILSGTDQDCSLERWWKYGAEARAASIIALRSLGVALVTTPNYSLFADAPRWDDMHSIKRIALTHSEFLAYGLPSALHVNCRSDRDIERWTSHVADREEITHLAYEFTTGSGRAERREIHARWLAHLANEVGRPLTVIVRGGVDILPILKNAYASVVFLETSAFMKTMNRQRALVDGNASIGWEKITTSADAKLDDLFDHNVRLTSEAIQLISSPSIHRTGAVAA